MKNKLFISVIAYLVLFFIFNIENCEGQWVQMSSGMGTSQTVNSLASNSNNIFAGTLSNGVYLSTNNGVNWTQTNLNNTSVWAFAVSGNNIFAGTSIENSHIIYISTNNGNNWTQTTILQVPIVSFAVNGNNIFAGSAYSQGVFFSSNNGANWTQTTLNPTRVFTLAVSGNNVFAGASGEYPGIYLSTNNGANWTITAFSGAASSLVVSGNNVFAGNGGGVYLTINNGASWTLTSFSQPIVTLATSGNNIFAGSQLGIGIYSSTNNGQNWMQRNEGFNAIATIDALLVTDNYIFMGTNANSVWRRPLSELVGLEKITSEVPKTYLLEQNYPNPFNSMTNVKWQMLNAGHAKITLYDLLGKEVSTLVNEKQAAGTYEVSFDASNLTSGIYFYSLFVDGMRIDTKRMVLIK
jgi:hypothetical protein